MRATIPLALAAAAALLPLPTATAHGSSWSPLQDLPPVCVPVYDYPDNGLAYCVDADGPCFLLERRTTIVGTEDTCLREDPL